MNTLDIIKINYMLYETALSSGKDETTKVIDVFRDDMDVTMKSSKTAVSENIRDEYLTKFKNFFYDLLGYEEEDVEHFSLDTGIVLRHSCLAERYKGYFDRMRDMLTDDNFQEINKLAMFTYESYVSNYRYLEMIRDGIKFSVRGIAYYSQGEDTQFEFNDFIEGQFEKLCEKGIMYCK